jgi:hypothetical protein
MTGNEYPIDIQNIESRIFTIRGIQVMLDSHLAEMYGISTGRLNEQVKRNIERFPEAFMFQMTDAEYDRLKSQNAIFENPAPSLRSQSAILKNKRGRHRKYMPYVFTEQGVAMLSSVLKSPMAIQVSIQIMQAFVEMRKFLLGHATLFQRVEKIELKLMEVDGKFGQIFKALESNEIKPKKGIFFDGQVFDAYNFVSDIIRSAEKSIFLIDNYIDDNVLVMLSKRSKGIEAKIFTRQISKQLELDLAKHNSQYDAVEIVELKEAHDRFLIIDAKELYHIGASLKDLGKKWFAFSKMDSEIINILSRLLKPRQ